MNPRDDDLRRLIRQADIGAKICQPAGHRLEGRLHVRTHVDGDGFVIDGCSGVCLHCGLKLEWRDPRPDPPRGTLPERPADC